MRFILCLAFRGRHILRFVIIRKYRRAAGRFRLFWSVRFNRVRLDGLLRAVGVCTLAGVTLLRRQRGDIHISLAIVDVHIGIVAVRLTAGYRSGGRHRISTEASGDPDDGHTAEQAADGDEDDPFRLVVH